VITYCMHTLMETRLCSHFLPATHWGPACARGVYPAGVCKSSGLPEFPKLATTSASFRQMAG